MKAASISEIKGALKNKTVSELNELCLHLARYKKENKELLTYLLFEADDESTYIKNVKEEIKIQFDDINKTNLYWAKKSLRKILKFTNKHIRYTGSKQAEAELLIYYCTAMQQSGIGFKKSTALLNLYNGQLKKIETIVSGLHEDLQYDYEVQISKLR